MPRGSPKTLRRRVARKLAYLEAWAVRVPIDLTIAIRDNCHPGAGATAPLAGKRYVAPSHAAQRRADQQGGGAPKGSTFGGAITRAERTAGFRLLRCGA